MRGRSRFIAAGATTVIAAMTLAACGSGGTGSGGDAPAPGSEEALGGEYVVNGCTPQNPLIVTNTTEVCGGNMIDLVTSYLMSYNPETAEPELDLAESVETDDSQNFTITLKQGQLFQDGTEVQAHNFVDAWSWAAYGPNGQSTTDSLEVIDGYDALQCDLEADPDCTPESDSLSGLEVVDDYTFTVRTAEPAANFPVRLGYNAFAPQPDAFFADESEGKEDFASAPIGAGPYQIESLESGSTVLTKFADYTGERAANADQITFRVYDDPSAAYADVLGGNLDIIDQIAPDQLIGDQYQADLGDRWEQAETMSIAYLSFSPADDQLSDNPDLRKAISRAIDRETLNQQLFNGTRPPLNGWGSPALPDWTPGACGDSCVFDAEVAKADFDAAGGYDGTLFLTTNPEGAGNVETYEAICNQLINTLEVDCQLNTTTDFASFLTGQLNDEFTGAWRSGWQASYPSLQYYLTPIYGTGGSSNYTRYSSPEFDAKTAEAAAAATPEESAALYGEAEEILAEDFPTAPLFSRNETIGWSTGVTNVSLTPFGTVDYGSVVVNS